MKKPIPTLAFECLLVAVSVDWPGVDTQLKLICGNFEISLSDLTDAEPRPLTGTEEQTLHSGWFLRPSGLTQRSADGSAPADIRAAA
jgi:hypothetical protein